MNVSWPTLRHTDGAGVVFGILTDHQPVRRATPDSEAVGSSEDERPWPSSMSFGKFPMKENSVPGMPGGIWGTQKRGSFKISEAAQRNAARDAARMGVAAANAPAPLLRGVSTPSPSVSEGASALPFAIPLQPTPKTGRSLSHSQGQREAPLSSGAHLGAVAGPTAAAALPLGLLAEEDVDTDTESDMGSRLTHTTSHPPIGSLMRTATLPASYDTMHSANGNRDRPAAPHSPSHRNLLRAQTFEAAFADLSMGMLSSFLYSLLLFSCGLTVSLLQTIPIAVPVNGRAHSAGTTCPTSTNHAATRWRTFLRAGAPSLAANPVC